MPAVAGVTTISFDCSQSPPITTIKTDDGAVCSRLFLKPLRMPHSIHGDNDAYAQLVYNLVYFNKRDCYATHSNHWCV